MSLSRVPRFAQSVSLWILISFLFGIAAGYQGWRLVRPERPLVANTGGTVPNSAAPQATDPQAEETRSVAATPPDPLSRIGILERITGTELEALPDLARELMAEDSFQLMPALHDRWIELDAQAGFAYFSDPDNRDSSRRWEFSACDYCGRWALVDPDVALSVARGIEGAQMQHVALDRVAGHLAAFRPADFLRLYPTSEPERQFTYRIPRATRALALSNPQEAVAFLNAMEAPTLGLAADVASGWAKKDPESALEWARNLENEGERNRALRAVAGRLLESDPERAATIYEESSQGEEPAQTGRLLIKYNWQSAVALLGETDPTAAMAWTAKHFPQKAGGMLTRFLPQDAMAAVEAIASLPDAVLEGGKLPGWPSDNWRPMAVEAAIEQLPSISDPTTRETLHAWLLGAQAVDDPGAAIESASRDLSDPANRAHVLKAGMATWVREDIAAASAWLATRPPGTETDGAIVSLVEVAKYAEPDSALTWAAAVSEKDTRLAQITGVIGAWRSVDEDAARAAVAAAQLSDEDKAELKKRGIDLFQ